MTGDNLLIQGSSFFLSDDRGDAGAERTQGLFAADVRHLSVWRLLVNGAPIRVVGDRAIGNKRARIFGIVADAESSERSAITVVRDRSIGNVFKEVFTFGNDHDVEQRLHVELAFAGDFADIFEIRGPARRGAPDEHLTTVRDESGVTLAYSKRDFTRETRLEFGLPFSLDATGHARFDITLPPGSKRELSAGIACVLDGPSHPAGRPGSSGGRTSGVPVRDLMSRAPKLTASSDLLRRTYEQSLKDLDALRFAPGDDPDAMVPAAGLPWFMALFGRDSLITAYQALPFAPDLARSTLAALARYQADEHDDFRDAEPGKILHELRRGKLAALGEIPHTPYYGTHDATPLFLILLDEFERWTGDRELARSLKEPSLRALGWMESHGDKDGDGYLEYQTRSPRGLVNHCWKDSRDSIVDARGNLARPPIATCEIQGYAYDAKRRAARLCRDVWDEDALADRLDDSARRLKDSFNHDFYNETDGTYVLALDGAKRRIDSVTSNIGHLLWSGIVDETRARAVAGRLMEPDLFSGWGLRTLSSNEVAYDPLGYHTGTVWPHDTALVAEGMRRYGFGDHAARLLSSLMEAAALWDHRLPEVFAGFARVGTERPVEYPAAARPQAWSAGAPLLALRTWLGMDAGGAGLACDPALPSSLDYLHLAGVHVRGELVDAPS